MAIRLKHEAPSGIELTAPDFLLQPGEVASKRDRCAQTPHFEAPAAFRQALLAALG